MGGSWDVASSWAARAGAAAACLAAAAVASTAIAAPADQGAWGPLVAWPIAGTHTVLLPTGKVLVVGEFEDGLRPHLWDPRTGDLRAIEDPGYNVFCSGHSRLADGRILFSGGHEAVHFGFRHTALFDPRTETWSHGGAMTDPRWYPTNVTLATGEVVAISGEIASVPDPDDPSNEIILVSQIPEVYDPVTDAWRRLTGAEQYIPYYPWCFVAPDARVFCAGQMAQTRWLDTTGIGKWTVGPRTLYGGARKYGSAALIGSRVFITGGDDPPTSSVEMLDLTDPAPSWHARAPMSSPRRQHQATILPDGKLLATGGSCHSGFDDDSCQVRYAELYDPDADGWTRLAESSVYAGYHSTALLLPDGRVLTGGGRKTRWAQVYSPPYLFHGARPVIAKAPAQVALAQRFDVETPDAARVARVTLIRLGAVTHSYDQDQRFLELSFERGESGLVVTAPAGNALAPAGDYMLFLLDGQGVPSQAAIVRVSQPGWVPGSDTDPVTPPPEHEHGGGASGGCSTAGGAAPLLAVALLAVVALRRRAAAG